MSASEERDIGEFSSQAWLRHGPKGMFGSAEPGILIARGDNVSFVTRNGPLFEAGRAEIQVNWPWWEFDAGVHLTVGGKIYRLSFARPARGAQLDPAAAAAELHGAIIDVRDAFKTRATGKVWKAYFAAGMAGTAALGQAAEPDA